MIFKRFRSDGLAHNSYIIGSDGQAAVIDPRRDCDIFIEIARKEDLKIKYILETHRNEDYAIGSIELAYFTGAEIFHGPGLDWKHGTTLKDGQNFHVGSLKIEAIHTPGHTPGSVSLYCRSEGVVFTGTRMMMNDISAYARRRLMRLPDDTIVYLGHGQETKIGIERNSSKRVLKHRLRRI